MFFCTPPIQFPSADGGHFTGHLCVNTVAIRLKTPIFQHLKKLNGVSRNVFEKKQEVCNTRHINVCLVLLLLYILMIKHTLPVATSK